MSHPEDAQAPGTQAPTFEAALAELESILHDLEEGQIGLEASLARYEQGVGLLKHCHALLEHAERRIELCAGVDAEGNPLTTPFDESPSSSETTPMPPASKARNRRRSTAPSSKPASSEVLNNPDEGSDPRELF